MMMPAAQPGLLEGVTVLDFSEQVPGPNATRVLSGLGADVIKIERPDGDRLRHRPAMFEAENRGKRSVAVDLKTDRRTGRRAATGRRCRRRRGGIPARRDGSAGARLCRRSGRQSQG